MKQCPVLTDGMTFCKCTGFSLHFSDVIILVAYRVSGSIKGIVHAVILKALQS